MPLLFQKFIYRADMRANPEVIYIFGDNCRRKGMGGQAKEMRGEPNAFGIPTKWTPGHSENDYFKDGQHEFIMPILEEHFDQMKRGFLEKGRTVIFPLDGIGTGLSKLPEYAPSIDKYIKTMVEDFGRMYSP